MTTTSLTFVSCKNDGCMVAGMVTADTAEQNGIDECPHCNPEFARFFLPNICSRCINMTEEVDETGLVTKTCDFFDGVGCEVVFG